MWQDEKNEVRRELAYSRQYLAQATPRLLKPDERLRMKESLSLTHPPYLTFVAAEAVIVAILIE